MNQKNELDRKEEYLKERVDKRINHGTKRIRNRLDFKNSTRFLVDIQRKIIHDTVNEIKLCHLDELFKGGVAETYLKTATEAVSEGYTPCRRCIGKSPKDIPDGRTSLLFTIFSPKRFAEMEILQKEHFEINNNFYKEVVSQLEIARQLTEILAQRNLSELVWQVRRKRTRDMSIDRWGKPDLVVSFATGPKSTLTEEDDALGVVYFPKDILRKESNPSRFQDSLLFEIFSLAGVRMWLSNHFQKYGYRNLGFHYHICDNIDYHTLHKENI